MITKNNKLTKDITEIKAKLYDMQSNGPQRPNVNTNGFESELAVLRSQIDSKKNEIEKFADELKTILVTQQSRLEQFKLDSESAISESVDLLNKLSSCASDEAAAEESDDNASAITLIQVNRDERLDTGFQSENSGQKNLKIRHTFNKPSTSKQISSQLNAKNNDDRTELYEIHISPFELNVSCDQIVQYIMGNLNGKSAKTFSVQRLGGYGFGHSFTSFKVSTFDIEIYNAVLSNELWEPNQIARPFTNSQPKRNRYNNDYHNENRQPYKFFQKPSMHRNNMGYWKNESQSNENYNRTSENRPYIPRFDHRQRQYFDDQSHNTQNRPQQQPQLQQHQQQGNRDFLAPDRGYVGQRRNSFNPFRRQQQN